MANFDRKCPFSREKCMGEECELALKAMCCFRSMSINMGSMEKTITGTIGPRAEGAVGILNNLLKEFQS
jgi:hypothetical protein